MTTRKKPARRRKPRVCTRYAVELIECGGWIGSLGERQLHFDQAMLWSGRRTWMNSTKYVVHPVRCRALSPRTKAARKRTR